MTYIAPLAGTLVGVLAGCATAGKDNNIQGHPDGGFIHVIDSAGIEFDAAPRPDAFIAPDAAPGLMTRTLSQTNNSTLLSAHSLACPASDVGTSANTYYRVFDLPSLGINTPFNVSTVTFQVEDCESVNGDGAPVAVRVGTYVGTPGTTLSPAGITVIASNNSVQVPETDELNGVSPGGTVAAPLTATIPAGSKLVVEVDAPDGNDTYQFYIGTNAGGQTAKGYVSSPTCPTPGTTPTDVGTLPQPPEEIDMLLTVTGTY